MRPRRTNNVIRLIAFLLLLPLCACSQMLPFEADESPAQKATPAPRIAQVPVPTPVPPPSILFLTDCAREEITPYVETLLQALDSKPWRVTQQYAPERFPEELHLNAYDGILVLRAKEGTSLAAIERAADSGVPVSIVDLFPQGDPPKGASYFWYEAEDAEEAALHIALSYPPHDTPVRLIGLFEEKGSPAYDALRRAEKEGKVLLKARFYAGKKPQRAKAFMEEQLSDYVEGTVDAVYAENMTLGLAALMALTERGRTDIEVFAVPEGIVYEQSRFLAQYVFPIALGADPAAWADLQVTALGGMLEGGAPVTSAFWISAVPYSG